MLLTKYEKINNDFTNYEKLKENFAINIPENFNFAYDVVDEYAKIEPDKKALVWCDDNENEKTFTFSDLKTASDITANFLTKYGIKKGDAVMLILRRRYEFWYFLLALHKIGAIAVPATTQLLQKDIEYRNNSAKIKMIVSIDNIELQNQIESALDNSSSVETLVTIGKTKNNWISF